MKICFMFMCCLIAASIASIAANAIEVEVRLWQLVESCAKSERGHLVLQDMDDVISTLGRCGNARLLSAPRIRTQSGTDATIKVVKEVQYPTDIDARRVSLTNGADIVHGVAVIPSGFETRDVGITLNVTPVYDVTRNMIDLTMMVEVVSEPSWIEYTASYEGSDGTKQIVQIPRPVFHSRRSGKTLSLHNNTTVVTGGLITTERRNVEDKVPVLGSIPWLGRLFRTNREVHERRQLLITVTARTVNGTR